MNQPKPAERITPLPRTASAADLLREGELGAMLIAQAHRLAAADLARRIDGVRA